MLPPILAGLALPGLGHVVLRRFGRAWAWLGALLALAIACAWLPWLMIALLVAWLASVVDAGWLARRRIPAPDPVAPAVAGRRFAASRVTHAVALVVAAI